MPVAETVRAPITGAVLTWAIDVGGFSRQDLAQSIGRPGKPEVIERWEREEDEPTIRQLNALSTKLKRPIATFFLPSPPAEPDPATTFKRTVALEAGGFSPELRLAIRATRYTRDRFIELLRESERDFECAIPVASVEDDPEDVAVAVRKAVGVTVTQQMKWPVDDSYRLWSEALMSAGVLPQQFEVDPSQAWGFSITDGAMPVAAVNRKIKAKNGRVFTLWHEVGHIALRESSVSTLSPGDSVSENKAERFCNSFAAAFLMPLGSDIVKLATRGFDLARLDEQSVQKAATRFRVSKYVMLGRLVATGAVPNDLARSLRREWWALDVSRDEEKLRRDRERSSENSPKIPRWKTALWDRGEIVAGTALDALARGRTTTGAVSDLLGVGPQDLEKIERSLPRRGGE